MGRGLAPLAPVGARQISAINDSFRDARMGYGASKSSPYRRPRASGPAGGSGADYHLQSETDYWRILEEVRGLDRDDTVIGPLLDRSADDGVQGGFTLDPNTPDEDLNKYIREELWPEWAYDAEQCDLAAEHTFTQLEWHAWRYFLHADGDGHFLGTDTGALEVFEAHRSRTPRNTKKELICGHERDNNRRVVRVWFTRHDVPTTARIEKVGEMRQVDVYDEQGHKQLFHVRAPGRFFQTRGVTVLRGCIDVAGMFEDVNFATLVKAQVASLYTLIRQRSESFVPPGGCSSDDFFAREWNDRLHTDRYPGMEIQGLPGETISGFAPNIPSEGFFPHMRFLLQLLSMAVGIPLSALLMDGKETNFSGWRGAWEEAKRSFRRRQQNLIEQFHTPVYCWKLRQRLASDPRLQKGWLKHEKRLFDHEWRPANWPYIQPLEDAKANLLMLSNMLTSPRRVYADAGLEHRAVVQETVADNAFAIRAAKTEAARINTEFPNDTPITWRDLAPLAPAQGGSFKADAPESANPAGADKRTQDPAPAPTE